MEVEDTTTPVDDAVSAESPEVDDADLDDGQDPDDVGDDEGEGEGSGEEDLEDVDLDGKKYKLPREVARGILREKDYTQKTQALSADRRAFEARQAASREAAQRETEIVQSLRKEVGQVETIRSRLTEYEKVDWAAVTRAAAQSDDPRDAVRVNQARMEFQALQDELQTAEKNLTSKTEELRLQSERERATRMQETGAVLAQEIENWSPEYAGELVKVGEPFGFTIDDYKTWDDPRAWKAMHALNTALKRVAALEGRQKTQAKASANAAAQTTTPAKTVTAKAAPPSRLSDDLTTKSWIERRNQQDAQKRGKR